MQAKEIASKETNYIQGYSKYQNCVSVKKDDVYVCIKIYWHICIHMPYTSYTSMMLHFMSISSDPLELNWPLSFVWPYPQKGRSTSPRKPTTKKPVRRRSPSLRGKWRGDWSKWSRWSVGHRWTRWLFWMGAQGPCHGTNIYIYIYIYI